MVQNYRREERDTSQDRITRNIRWGLSISLSIILAILLIAGILSFVAPTTPSERKDVVQATGVLIAAVAGLFGLVFTAQNVRTNQRTLQANLRHTEETLQLTERG